MSDWCEDECLRSRGAEWAGHEKLSRANSVSGACVCKKASSSVVSFRVLVKAEWMKRGERGRRHGRAVTRPYIILRQDYVSSKDNHLLLFLALVSTQWCRVFVWRTCKEPDRKKPALFLFLFLLFIWFFFFLLLLLFFVCFLFLFFLFLVSCICWKELHLCVCFDLIN